jgi:hypothetical protein
MGFPLAGECLIAQPKSGSSRHSVGVVENLRRTAAAVHLDPPLRTPGFDDVGWDIPWKKLRDFAGREFQRVFHRIS